MYLMLSISLQALIQPRFTHVNVLRSHCPRVLSIACFSLVSSIVCIWFPCVWDDFISPFICGSQHHCTVVRAQITRIYLCMTQDVVSCEYPKYTKDLVFPVGVKLWITISSHLLCPSNLLSLHLLPATFVSSVSEWRGECSSYHSRAAWCSLDWEVALVPHRLS